MASQTVYVKVQVDPASPAHPYVQVADQLRAGILAGEAGPLLPSITDDEAMLALRTFAPAMGNRPLPSTAEDEVGIT